MQGSSLIIRPEEPMFYLGTYYITLDAHGDSEVTINIDQNAQIVRLIEGLPQRAALSSEITKYFIYTFPSGFYNSNSEQGLSLFVKFFEPVKNPIMLVKYTTRGLKNMPSLTSFDKIFRYDRDLEQLGGIVEAPSQNQKEIAIAVLDPENKHIGTQFDITAWVKGFPLLFPLHTYYEKISDPGQMKIFELSLQKESKVFIEVIPCIGEVEFSVSKTLNSAYSQDALELRASELKRGRIFGSLKAVPGVHFVTVRGIAKSTSLKEFNEGIQFTIRTIISNAEDESELEDFTLENYGTITFELQSNELKLSWGRVFQRSRGNSLPVEAKYSVYMSEDSSANFQTICGIKYSRAKMIAKDLTSTSVTYKIKDKRKDKRLGFNVIAQLPQHSQSVAYTPVFLQVPNSSSLSKSYIVATIMIIIDKIYYSYA